MQTAPTISKELVELLQAVKSTGNVGLYTMFVVLLALVAIAVLVLLMQRQVIRKLNEVSSANAERVRVIETQIKVFDSVQKGLVDQHGVVRTTNDDLRKELERLQQKQDGLKQSLKDTITEGLADLQSRLEGATVKGILDQVPASFRSDLEKELAEATDRALKVFLDRLRTDPQIADQLDPLKGDMKTIGNELRERIGREMEHVLYDFRRQFEHEFRRFYEHPYADDSATLNWPTVMA